MTRVEEVTSTSIVETRPSTRTRVVRVLVRIAVVVLTVWIAVGLLSAIDFSKVWDAMTTVSLRDAAVMLALLAVLRTLNATPIDLFIPRITLPKAVLNDSTAYLVSTVSPPPSDMVLRYSMFKAWHIDVTAAFAGVALNSILFYVVRFAAPIAGVLILVIVTEVDSNVVLASSLSALVAVGILTTLIAVMRAEKVAAAVGRAGGRIGHRFRPSDVDPEDWAGKVVEFRSNIGDQLRRTWPRASLAMFGMTIVDATILLTALRSVGIDSAALPALLVYGAFLVGYPLTALPFAGLGVFDALLYTLAIDRLGSSYADLVVAALILWRVTTVLTPLLIGVFTYSMWRRSQRSRDAVGFDDEPAQWKQAPIPGEAGHRSHPQSAEQGFRSAQGAAGDDDSPSGQSPANREGAG